jgi:HSP20 family molecular chaperone IbpA
MVVQDIFGDDLTAFEREFMEMRKRMLALVMQNTSMEWHPDEEPETIERRRPRQRRVQVAEDEDGMEISTTPDGIEMVMSVPWAKEGDITVAAKADALTVAAGGERGFLKQVRTPARIRPSTCAHTVKNGVLHITAKKQRARQKPA